MPRTQATDESEQKLLDDVQKFGWHCMNVSGDEEHEPFAYTIGLFQTYGYPEVLIYGLARNVAHAVITIAAEAAAKGMPFNLDEATDGLVEDYSCVFVPVPLGEYREHVGFALWYYQGSEFPVYQIVWPSKAGHFPWHEDASDAFRAKQPVLGQQARGA